MQLKISSRRDIAVLQKESSSLKGEEDVNGLLESAIDRPARRVLRAMQPSDVRSTAADIDLTTRELNWQPTTIIEDGLPRLVDWVRRYYAYDAR